MNQNKINWIFQQHRNTNHLYDGYIPYEFHLKMTERICLNFIHLHVPDTRNDPSNPDVYNLRYAVLAHDLIEDTRVSYNDVKEVLGEEVADIVYTVSNEKGKTRKERANDKYYEGIRNTPGAVFVKLCDRIANVQYSKMTGSRMFEMYKKENIDFMVQLGRQVGNPYEPMFQYLKNLFND